MGQGDHADLEPFDGANDMAVFEARGLQTGGAQVLAGVGKADRAVVVAVVVGEFMDRSLD
jgi:hypothetical protein